jgi:hypothetical protein
MISRDRRRRYTREQEVWIAKAKAAPSYYKASLETKAIIKGLKQYRKKTPERV